MNDSEWLRQHIDALNKSGSLGYLDMPAATFLRLLWWGWGCTPRARWYAGRLRAGIEEGRTLKSAIHAAQHIEG